MNDVTGMPQTVVVLGGGSDLSRAILRVLAGRRLTSVLLTGRTGSSLEAAAEELRGLSVPKVETEQLDVTEIGALESFADAAVQRLGDIDLVLIAAGELDMADLTTLDARRVASLTTTNFTGPAAAMTAFARVLRAQGHGQIVVLSSVAG
jgi:decaprenylphospho-beta-D-erythro-pentofuranosid-2-ulose 2-reductase